MEAKSLEQIPHGFFRSLPFPELAVGGRQHHMRAHVAGQIEIERGSERAAVVPLAIRVVEVRKPEEAGVIRIQLLGACRKYRASLAVARIRQQLSEKREGVAVHRIERDGPFRRVVGPCGESYQYLAMIGYIVKRAGVKGSP